MPADTELPVVFLSYSFEDEFQVRQLSEDLRKAGVQTLTYQYELDRDGERLVDAVQRYAAKPRVLALAITPAMAKWVRVHLKSILASLEDELRDIIRLKLV